MGFYLDGSPAFEQWALLERERLRTLAIAAYQQLVDQAATAGQLEVATAYAQRLLQLDPWHEPTHRQLMRLLAHAGQRSAALAQYETCRTLLAAELGVAPDETTTALYEQLRTQAQDVGVGNGATINIGQTAPPPVADNQNSPISPAKSHNLPLQSTPLIGRSAELAQIASLLANPDCRLLTLLGVGGIGKTRLAIDAAKRLLDADTRKLDSWVAEEVCFVALASVEKAELVLATIAKSLELQATGSELQAEIAAYLEQRTLLLVLDNFEHLPDAADTIAQLLQGAAGVKILVTSRERLHLREEWLMPVAGLALAEGLMSEAGQLFFRSAQRVQPALFELWPGRGDCGDLPRKSKGCRWRSSWRQVGCASCPAPRSPASSRRTATSSPLPCATCPNVIAACAASLTSHGACSPPPNRTCCGA